MIFSGVGLLCAALALLFRLTFINWYNLSGLIWYILSAIMIMGFTMAGLFLIVQGLLEL